ncbi:hypothetical protein PENTCL1PPCAC_7590, partial [Pristionchus entomophagus]
FAEYSARMRTLLVLTCIAASAAACAPHTPTKPKPNPCPNWRAATPTECMFQNSNECTGVSPTITPTEISCPIAGEEVIVLSGPTLTVETRIPKLTCMNNKWTMDWGSGPEPLEPTGTPVVVGCT